MKRAPSPRPGVIAPFTPYDVDNWNAALRQCEYARELCELGIQAGIPCDDMLTECQATRDKLTKLKQTFAPGLP